MSLLSRMLGTSKTAMTPAEAHAAASRGDVLLVDVRETAEVRSGHSEHAEHIPLGTLAGELGRLAAAGKPVAFVCRSGGRSASAVSAATQAGIDARNVTGGMTAWQRAGLPMRAGAVKRGGKRKLF